jgi:hypothetical protein
MSEFCGGYDLVQSAKDQGQLEGEGNGEDDAAAGAVGAGRAFPTLFHCGKPVVCKVHGFCVAGAARYTPEGFAFQGLAAREGFRAAVRERDQGFGDPGPSTFKG